MSSKFVNFCLPQALQYQSQSIPYIAFTILFNVIKQFIINLKSRCVQKTKSLVHTFLFCLGNIKIDKCIVPFTFSGLFPSKLIGDVLCVKVL